jgi:hypothetical protein
MLRPFLLPVLLALALPATGRCESIDLATHAAAEQVPVVRGPAAGTGAGFPQPTWSEPARFGMRARFDAAGESAETLARAAVVVVRGSAGAPPEPPGDPDLELQLALVRMLTGLCRLDPRIRDAAAEDLLSPLPASL